ncbi:unnamed protein product, partial [Rotaria magnacalcarata]
PCSGCIKHQEDIIKLSKRIDRLEKVIPVIKKFRTKTSCVSKNLINTTFGNNTVYTRIQTVTGVDPNQLRSTISRPTMKMRELIKNAGYINDKAFLKSNENLFKGQYTIFKLSTKVAFKKIYLEFIQMKCTILDDNIDDHWKEITDSLGRQHIDEENNKKKRIRPEQSSATLNPTPHQITQTFLNHDEHELATVAPTTINTISDLAEYI